MSTEAMIGILLGGVGVLATVIGYFFTRRTRKSRTITVQGANVGGDIVGGDKKTSTKV